MFLSMLTILFIGLKLCNVIDWSWVVVLSPLWVCFVLAGVLYAIQAARETF